MRLNLQLFCSDDAGEDREGAFNDLIYGQYKDLYQLSVNGVLDKRMEAYQTLHDAYQNSLPLMDALSARYGTSDVQALLGALEEDESEDGGEGEAAAQYLDWVKQGEAVASRFPDFDVDRECENPLFLTLLKSGIDMETAYIALNRDEVIQNALHYAAMATQKSTLDSIRKGVLRPIENGIRPSGGITAKTDVSKLTEKERRDIARRAADGERITF